MLSDFNTLATVAIGIGCLIGGIVGGIILVVFNVLPLKRNNKIKHEDKEAEKGCPDSTCQNNVNKLKDDFIKISTEITESKIGVKSVSEDVAELKREIHDFKQEIFPTVNGTAKGVSAIIGYLKAKDGRGDLGQLQEI